MIDPFTLFQAMPAPPAGVAAWVDVQLLEEARAQSYWAANQAYWARFGAWTQLAAFIAAGFAAWFTWNAAKHAQVQADAAQVELRIAREGRAAESRVRAFELLSLLDGWFLPARQVDGSPSRVREQLSRVMRTAETESVFREEPRSQVREEGVRIAAGIQPDSVLLRWIKLFDDANHLRSRDSVLAEEFKQLLVDHGRSDLGRAHQEDDRALAETIFANAPSLAAARLAVAQFWNEFDLFRAHVESIGRGGAALAGSIAPVTVITGNLTSIPSTKAQS